MSGKRVQTDGEIALEVNKIVRSIRQLGQLNERRFSPEIQGKRAQELRDRIDALIAIIDSSSHLAAREIAESVRSDYKDARTMYIAAGARRFFGLPLNWQIMDGEVVAGTVKARKPGLRTSPSCRKSRAR